ncbi:MAG: ABC transporter substrate-binding protein [Clostridiales bacterium]|nr:ABC transporter substrate-binding protein [Clostridiales bacterium]
MKTKRYLSFFLALVMASFCFMSAACSKKKDTNDDSKTHIVTDHNGNQVEVKNKIDRIVVCDILPLPSVLTVFFDSAEKIVGMNEASMLAAKNGLLGQIYPEILNASTSFMDGSNVNIEELAKLEPDVVFYSGSNKELGEQLRSKGFAAIGISVNKWQYNTIETLNNWFSLLGEIFSENEKAEKVAKRSNEIYKLVQDRVSSIPADQKRRVFFLFQINDTTITTSGKQFFGQFWSEAIGAVNVGEELTKDNSVSVNIEQVYTWNPDLIFITNFNQAYPQDLYDNTIGNYDWSEVDAVKNKQVFKMPLGMYRSYTPGADTPITLLFLAKCAYPDLFSDIDITKETKDYYKDLFGITLTDEQANSIFNPNAASGNVNIG